MKPKEVLGPVALALIGAFTAGGLFLYLYDFGFSMWAVIFGEAYILFYLLFVQAKEEDLKGVPA